MKEKIDIYISQAKAQNWKIILLIFIGIVIFDQATKQYFEATLIQGQPVPVISDFFQLTLHYNKGIAFGIRLFENQIIFVLFTILAIIFIFFALVSLEIKHKLMPYVIGLIMGGAFGNLIDRAIFHQVIDFLDVEFWDIHIESFSFLGIPFSGYHMERWPIFNIADSAVMVGMFFSIYLMSRQNKEMKALKNDE